MLATPTELVTALVDGLPPELRKLVEAHFFDGESVYRLQRQRKMKRRDLEAMLDGAKDRMRMALHIRGVARFSDVL